MSSRLIKDICRPPKESLRAFTSVTNQDISRRNKYRLMLRPSIKVYSYISISISCPSYCQIKKIESSQKTIQKKWIPSKKLIPMIFAKRWRN